jgi:hypothetical protein
LGMINIKSRRTAYNYLNIFDLIHNNFQFKPIFGMRCTSSIKRYL